MRDGGYYPLHFAANGGDLSIANLLLQAGATVDAVDDDGRTALHCAAYDGKIQVVEALLNAGADKAVKDQDGMTALDKAQRKNHPAIVKLLRDWSQEAAAAAEVEAPEAAAVQQELSEVMYRAAVQADVEPIVADFCSADRLGPPPPPPPPPRKRRREPAAAGEGGGGKRAAKKAAAAKAAKAAKAAEDPTANMDELLKKYDTDGSISNLLELERENPEAMVRAGRPQRWPF